ncbi:MAG: hypothetical protein N2053_05450 [Chitinispirillaceae bacterium]|nr:hypothetical protein [Chitinispirillaceae bacterium]
MVPHPFSIPLPLITVLFERDQFIEAFVTFNESNHEGWAIGLLDDRYVKDTRSERVDHFYRERINSAYRISPFEAQVMERVCKKFEETLIIFERELKNHKWEKLLYLDLYFPPFFKGFFYLYCGANNSLTALPEVTKISDSLYEENTILTKSRRRILLWKNNPEQIMKLRIAAKELVYEMKEWRKNLHSEPEFDPRKSRSKKFIETYELFIRLYFNLPPQSVIKNRGF